MTSQQPLTLFDPLPKGRRAEPTLKESILAAMDRITGSADTTDIQRVLMDYWGKPLDRNVISKRLQEMERVGITERVGHNHDRRGSPTTWRRTGRTLA